MPRVHGPRWRRAALAALATLTCAAGAGVAAVVHASTTATLPFVAQGAKLVPPEARFGSHVGRSVALSRDGNTALIGGPRETGGAGAAWIYTRSGTTWTQRARLEAPKGEGSSFFGRGVALSADGSTALIGDPGNAENVGAAWAFARTGSKWTLQEKLVASDESGQGQFGRSVALSADGSLALVGAFADGGRIGAAWTFARSGSAWEQQGSKLTGTGEEGEGWFGRGVSVSGDGTIAAVGASNDAGGIGAVWTFARSGVGWEQQGSKLEGAAENGEAQLGESVALSQDGSTLVAGGPEDGEGTGAAWVFGRSGATWTQQGPKLKGRGEFPPAAFGYSVSLSGDGSTAIAGGYGDLHRTGAAWTFIRESGEWAPLGTKLTGAGEAGEGRFGYGVALSADGSTAMVGGISDGEGIGAAWPFVQPPPAPPVEPPVEPPIEEGTPTTPTTGTGATSTAAAATVPPAGGVLSNTTVSAPSLAHTGNVEPVSGKVFLRLPKHKKFELLPGLRQIPFGTVVDATGGKVLLTAAKKNGGTQTGEFFSGEFLLTQGKGGVVIASLTGGQATACTASRAARAGTARTRRKRKLWANAHGTFSTKGNYAVGAVQGTEWLTEDNCAGTLIRVTRDKVKVTDLVRHKSKIVKAGHSILVRHP